MKSKALSHLLDRYKNGNNPASVQQLQDAYNRLRLKDCEDAMLTRPEYIQIQNALPGTAQSLPISETSSGVRHPVIVIGGITDGEDRDGNFYKKRTGIPFINVGTNVASRMSLDSIAGKSVASAGLAGVQPLIAPFELLEDETITLDIYDDPAVADTVTTVFTGLRSFRPDQDEGKLSGATRQQVIDLIKRYNSPQPRFLTAPVTFANNVAEAESPKHPEPLLVYGFRTTFTDALVNFGLKGSDEFARAPFAIWALASEKNNARMLYQPLPRPLLVPKDRPVYFKFNDSIDNVTFATDGQIEVFATTP